MNIRKISMVKIISYSIFILFTFYSMIPANHWRETIGENPGFFIEYPYQGSIFPADMIAPTFRWHCSLANIDAWEVMLSTVTGKSNIGAEVNQKYWKPTAEQWENFKKTTQGVPVRLRVQAKRGDSIVQSSEVNYFISRDKVGARIFYRDVPLPFSFAYKHLETIRWRLGDISVDREPEILLENLPLCGNCHSFSSDGSKLAMDVDYANDKGSYIISDIRPITQLSTDKIMSWSEYRRRDGVLTFGLLSQISPDGRFAVSTVKDRSIFVPKDDLHYSQLFFPIRGILAVYDIEKKKIWSLPGADDPAYVQSNPTWSPDGQYIVFARAKVYRSEAADKSKKAVLPTSVAAEFISGKQGFQFDLYRVPFNNGQGGRPEPIPGASRNGMSNYFPKFSPDGHWIVFCRAKNFMLLQPDSQLYIIPANGGEARRMKCNRSDMNSWHSWSPNSRWLVFASKAKGPYTQLYLTHIDKKGNDSPPVLLENLTLKKRAANIPEFLNLGQKQLKKLVDKFSNSGNYPVRIAMDKFFNNDIKAAITAFDDAIKKNPQDPSIYFKRGDARFLLKDYQGAIKDFSRNIEMEPNAPLAYKNRGDAKLKLGLYREAIADFNRSIQLKPNFAKSYVSRGKALNQLMKFKEALIDFNQAISINKEDPEVYVGRADALLAFGQLKEALADTNRALKLDPEYYQAFSQRAMIKSRAKDRKGALADINKAIELSPQDHNLYNNRAIIKASSGDANGALIDINKAIEMEKNIASLYVNRGVIRGNLGDFEGAISDFSHAIKQNPTLYKAYNQRAGTWFKVKNYNEALQDIGRAIELNPDYYILFVNRGNFYFAMQKYQKALSDYKRAQHLDPKNGTIFTFIGDCHYKLKQFAEAQQAYSQAATLQPKEAKNYFRRGMMHLILKERRKACADFQRAAKLGSKSAAEALKKYCH